MSTVAPERQPYKFLDYFEESDEEWFFGRERDVDKIVTRIAKDRISVLYGRSGVGKTSLIRAGVIPALRRRKYLPIYVRVTRFAIADLVAAIAAHLGATTIAIDVVPELLRAGSQTQPIVLVLDQIEEFFVETDAPERRQERDEFIRHMKAIVDDTSLRIRIAFSVREEYLARLEAIKDLHDGLLSNAERLQPLSAFGAREAVVGPLEKLGIRYSDKFADRLVDALAEVGFDTPTLQIVCQQVYLDAKARDPAALYLDEQALERLGGIDGIYERYLDGVTGAIPPEQQFLACAVVEALVTRERTKRAVTLDMLREGRIDATDEELLSALAALIEHRLVREESRGGARWYELAHERVIKSALEWLDRDEAFFNFRITRELIINLSRGERWRKQPKALLTADQLDIVNQHVRRLRLERAERDFLVWSAVFRGSNSGMRIYAATFPPVEVAWNVEVLVQHADPLMRWAAYTTVAEGNVPGVGPALIRCCLNGALHDPDEEARRAAIRAATRVASKEEVSPLVSARDENAVLAKIAQLKPEIPLTTTAERLTVERLLSIGKALGMTTAEKRLTVERLLSIGKALGMTTANTLLSIGKALGMTTAERLTAELLEAHRTTIRARRSVGMISGLEAAVFWMLIVSAPAWVLLHRLGQFTWHIVWDHDALSYVIGGTSGFSLLAGAIVGAAAGTEGAHDAILHGEGHWDRALRREHMLVAIVMLLSLPIFVFTLVAGLSRLISDIGIVGALVVFGLSLALELGAVALLVFPLRSLVVRLVRFAFASGAAIGTGVGGLFWSFATSTGPLLLALVLVILLDPSSGRLATVILIAAQFIATITFVALVALRAGSFVAPIHQVPPAASLPSTWARAIAAGSLSLAVVLGIWLWR